MTDDVLELRVAWEQHLGRGAAADEWFASVVRRHRGPGRHYHGVRHVRWVVRHVLDLAARHPVTDLDAIVAAAFFHDVVYEPTASDNEAASARLATTALAEIGWPPPRADRVATMILATADHDVSGADPDTAILLAADLGVLATDPARYGDYVRAVRREYAHVSDADWRTGRTAVLRALFDRAALFPTGLGLDEWERRARANIAAELAGLGSATDPG